MKAFACVVVGVVGASSCCPPMQDPATPKVVVMPAETITATPVEPVAPVEPVVPPGPPIARTVDVVDKQFGLELPDPYRWMEGIENPEHTKWLTAQAEYARGELAKPRGREALFARIRELGLGVSAVYGVQRGGKRLFYGTLPANAQLGKLVVREPEGQARVLGEGEARGTPESPASVNR